MNNNTHCSVIDTVVRLACFLALLSVAMFLCYREATRETRERAAWNQGYYGVDRESAMKMARLGIGKTVKELISH